MLDLTLRKEFLGKRHKGTTIELSNDSKTGATQISAKEFLEITYPTHDLLKGIEAIGPDRGRPVVVIGERGIGKSHLLAALHHAVSDPASTSSWLASWGKQLKELSVSGIQLRHGMHVISESLHRQRYKFLWDLLLERHPHGTYIKGKWEGMGASKTDIPSDTLIIEMLEHTPSMLLLDEFQTWFDGLTNTKQFPWKNWAFNFIQMLSEIAQQRPDLLVLVISVRNGGSDAYQQVHRVNPVSIDFMAGGDPERVQQDRRRMLLHRLFENRLTVTREPIKALIAPHLGEYLRLMAIPTVEHDRYQREFEAAWPFAPHLLRLLEEQVLIATEAQETRDMIRILANLYKSRGNVSPVLTAADFRLDDDSSGIGALLDSVANEHHRSLRGKAQQNIISVKDAVPEHKKLTPHLEEIMGALWLRSIAVGNHSGAEPSMLQVDITRDKPIDDNAFQVELATIVDNSFNIHHDGTRRMFREAENPRARLMASARNDRLFVDRSDHLQLAKQIKYVIGGSNESAKSSHVIVLPQQWSTNPWPDPDDMDHPGNWTTRLPILVLPEQPEKLDSQLGEWLKNHLQTRRNTVRFLLPRSGMPNAFNDHELLVLVRAEMKAMEWSGQNPEYRRLQREFEGTLRELLKKRFDRFAVLRCYDHQNPGNSAFNIELLKKQGSQIPEGIEECLTNDLFVPEDFEVMVIAAASANDSLGKLLRELQEPRPGGQDCIPWLGEISMKERVLKLCARGLIAINVRGLEYLQANTGEDEERAWMRLRSKLSISGRQLDEVHLMPPSAVPSTGGATPQPSDGEGGEIDGEIVTPPTTPPTGGGIYGGGGSSKPHVSLSNPPTSPLNLIGKLDVWGIGPATHVKEVSLKVSAASGAQLKEILKKLPDGLTFELRLEKEE